ncbi:MAG: 3-phosphoshikimate 1-carboxyvinyltransferase, partial [bacterium]
SRLHNEQVRLDAHNDHRLAMAFSILGICRGNITVTGAGAVSKSYPDFFKDLAALDAKFQQK